jgi:hypothetical protein
VPLPTPPKKLLLRLLLRTAPLSRFVVDDDVDDVDALRESV